MPNQSQLERAAADLAGEQLGALLAIDFELVPGPVEEAWRPTMLRRVYEQTFGIYHPFREITVERDAHGRIVAFSDPVRLHPDPVPEAVALTNEEALAIVGTSGVLGSDASIESLDPVPGNLIRARIDADGDGSRIIDFVINPSEMHVAAFHPAEDA